MPSETADLDLDARPRAVAGPALLTGFAAALFASAFLVFALQPMVSRLLLPRLGGSPAVWNTCVCFFQAVLLLGYGYAHLATRRLAMRAQIALHAVVLAAAMTALPFSLGSEPPPPEASPVGWLLARLTLGVGLPFIAIAATAPMLQVWFSRTAHPHARDPYFLYAASNAGSLLALLGYPLLIETSLTLSEQVRSWSAAYATTALVVLVCGAASLRQAAPVAPAAVRTAAALPAGERLRWIVLAFVPSALMLAVTTHITTDIASAPLFWVAPLAVYILTFVFAFARRPLFQWRALLLSQGMALAAAGAVGVMSLGGAPHAAALLAPLAAFALTAMVCHAELAERRPDVGHLTGYFFLISTGGALGGLFNALLAPVLFPVPLEYPLLLVAACLLRPPASLVSAAPASAGRIFRSQTLAPASLLVSAVGSLIAFAAVPGAARAVGQVGPVLLCGAVLLWFVRRRTPFALALGGMLIVPALAGLVNSPVVARGFFGVHRVRLLPADDLIVLQNGTTLHGAQSTRPGEDLVPLAYYHREGPFGRLFGALGRRPAPMEAVGVLGLGTGALGCYARPGEAWTFHEIDPLVERIARDDRWFRFTAGCGNRPAVVLGDARVALSSAEARYDLLIVDVFSSDSVPIHLITKEAMALYFSRLKPGGLVVFHISNRYLDLAPVIARLAADAETPVRHLFVPPSGSWRMSGGEAVAVARPGGDLEALAADGWDVPAPGPVLWTDERSDVLRVVRWR